MPIPQKPHSQKATLTSNLFHLPPTGQDDPSSENLEEAKLELDPEHLKIATIAAKVCGYFSSINHRCFLRPLPFAESFDPDCFLSHQYPPNAGAEHASSVFAMGAFNQLSVTRSLANVANHSYDSTFREFVRMRTRMILLIPNLEAYSNNPHKHGVLARTLFYLVLVGCLGLPSFSVTDNQSFTPLQDAVDKQPNELDGGSPRPCSVAAQFRGGPQALLNHYWRSHQLLTNILKTLKTTPKEVFPARNEMLALIYADLPPNDKKMSRQQIDSQFFFESAYANPNDLCLLGHDTLLQE
ncbi:hypothetical protein PGTUg99_001191 [Puccinia graminis f. sp. tritici]|uniref:Uncharacterized protein n=1 Tax=Puccinia graminis f. sp. tritici TaxID=56615 RepID=A0A5B0QWF8_PUCGR|nr:hypothetical protein PGTUg99_001191 [Puccinia graminis f. sp. tritici]